MALSKKQKEQVTRQIKGNQHPTHKVDIALIEDFKLMDFIVYQDILNPEGVAALYLAQWLVFNNGLYDGKTVIDIGCGSGIQGIVMAQYGAKSVLSSDIAEGAVKNTRENVTSYGLERKVNVVQGDLFEKIDRKADLIVFNHPFFPAEPYPEIPVSLAMLNNGELIHRFLDDARRYLEMAGRIIMPYFEMAGKVNDPLVQGPKHGYQTEMRFRLNAQDGLQKGNILIYELGQKAR